MQVWTFKKTDKAKPPSLKEFSQEKAPEARGQADFNQVQRTTEYRLLDRQDVVVENTTDACVSPFLPFCLALFLLSNSKEARHAPLVPPRAPVQALRVIRPLAPRPAKRHSSKPKPLTDSSLPHLLPTRTAASRTAATTFRSAPSTPRD